MIKRLHQRNDEAEAGGMILVLVGVLCLVLTCLLGWACPEDDENGSDPEMWKP